MSTISKAKMQYSGPWHYWNHYSLNPRERYYYGYYGMYGPHTDKSLYTPVGGNDTLFLRNQNAKDYDKYYGAGWCGCEGFDGGCGCTSLSGFLKLLAIAILILFFFRR